MGMALAQSSLLARMGALEMIKAPVFGFVIAAIGCFEGLRVTPNVYTTLEEIDTFTGAMMKMS
jgi:ABC-type transporter Mla maintaining outer membrane lipid asymmetry permease subunit MlaE